MKTGTICSKHSEIESDAKYILQSNDLENIHDYARNIISLVENCLYDGNNMEKGLERKKKQIEELEQEKYDLEKQVRKLEDKVYELENDNSKLTDEIDLLNNKLEE